ncbi:MAG: hypothetical protein CMP11_04000 [Zetaproteobacteria bacterium]|nr:hypothetical protein [Pseudobdellovibrionaceae bacterium]
MKHTILFLILVQYFILDFGFIVLGKPNLHNPEVLPWVRFNDSISQLSISPHEKYFSYIDKKDNKLKIFEYQTKDIYTVSKIFHQSDSFFWSPYGFRLFYTESSKVNGQIKVQLKAFDCASKKHILIESFKYQIGYLTFYPKDFRTFFYYEGGVHVVKLDYPGMKIPQWQRIHKKSNGNWVVAPGAVLWSSSNGLLLKDIFRTDDQITSFSISADALFLAWATESGKVYMADERGDIKWLGYGKDPKWHPQKDMMVYSAARLLGQTIIGYDLRLTNSKGDAQWLSKTGSANERWPNWLSSSESIAYTQEGTTDVFILKLQSRLALKQNL